MKKRSVFATMVVSLMLIVGLGACGTTDVEEPVATSEVEETTVVDEETEETAITATESPENLEVELNEKLVNKYAADDEDGLLNPDYSANTDIVFSEGNSEDWKYSHNKREFPIEKCYAKVSTSLITKHFWGKEDAAEVYFIFTGAENCSIESTKGVVDNVKSDDSNVIIFKKTLYAAKAKKAETIVSEFKIVPKKACGLRIDVIYDSSVPRKYDDSSTIYFTKN